MTAKRVRADVKPLTHWAIYKGYLVRFTARGEAEVRGVLTTAQGPVDFVYNPATRTIRLPDNILTINEYGWEIGRDTLPGPLSTD